MRLSQTAWLNFPLQRPVSWSLFYGQTMPNPMWEKWGLRAKAAHSPGASRHSLGWRQIAASRAIMSAYSWLGTGKHNILDKRSKPCCPTPSQRKSGNSPFWRLSSLAAASHLAHLIWFFPNILPKWYHVYPKERQSCWKVEWVVLGLDSQGAGYQD